MNRILTFGVATAVLVFVGLFVSVELGTGNVIPAAVLGGLATFILIVTFLGRGQPADLVVLTLAAAGMILCGKGFAYLRLHRLLFMGEAVLALCLIFYIARIYLGQFRLIPRTPMAWPLAAILVYSGLHLVNDYQTWGLWAVRDSCMSYYCLFFFFAYQLGTSFPSGIRYATRIFLMIAPIAVLLGLVMNFSPGIMHALRLLRVQKAPLIMPHEAITNATLGLALFFCCRRHEDGRAKLLSLLAGILILALIVIQGRGAAIVGLGVLGMLALLARQWRLLLTAPIILIAIAVPSLYLISQTPMYGERSRLLIRQLQEINPLQYFERGYRLSPMGSTAEWRLAWWSLIWKETMEKNPAFGLGFGADLGGEFAESMMGQVTASEEASRTRFPHNALFSFVGRLGLLGAALFSWAIIVQLMYFVRFARRWRTSGLPARSYYLWGFIIVGFAVTFFQYTWEAAYIALPYWLCVGLAYAELDALDQAEAEPVKEEVRVPAARSMAKARPATIPAS